MSRFKTMLLILLSLVVVPSLFSRDVLLEFKGSYFLPTNSHFKDCYKGSALYGPELSVQLWDDAPWYVFASAEYYKQKGRFLSLCYATKLRLIPIGAGIKYFIPIADRAKIYFGLGFQAEHLNKKSKRLFVTSKNTYWGFGGIGKMGAYMTLPHNFLLDLFVNYSFVWTSKNNFYGNTVVPSRVNLGGVIFGAGITYSF